MNWQFGERTFEPSGHTMGIWTTPSGVVLFASASGHAGPLTLGEIQSSYEAAVALAERESIPVATNVVAQGSVAMRVRSALSMSVTVGKTPEVDAFAIALNERFAGNAPPELDPEISRECGELAALVPPGLAEVLHGGFGLVVKIPSLSFETTAWVLKADPGFLFSPEPLDQAEQGSVVTFFCAPDGWVFEKLCRGEEVVPSREDAERYLTAAHGVLRFVNARRRELIYGDGHSFKGRYSPTVFGTKQKVHIYADLPRKHSWSRLPGGSLKKRALREFNALLRARRYAPDGVSFEVVLHNVPDIGEFTTTVQFGRSAYARDGVHVEFHQASHCVFSCDLKREDSRVHSDLAPELAWRLASECAGVVAEMLRTKRDALRDEERVSRVTLSRVKDDVIATAITRVSICAAPLFDPR